MRKFICYVLIIIACSITCIGLSACNDDKYNITDFHNSYIQIADKYDFLKLTSINQDYGIENTIYKIDIDYSSAPNLLALVNNNSTKYSYLKTFYQKMLDNALSPVYFYSQDISNSKNISKSQTETLYEKLNDLEDEYSDLDNYFNILASRIQASASEDINLSQLKALFNQYEEAISVACDLSNIVCDIYFNTVVTSYNLDYSNVNYSQLSDADLITIYTNGKTRIHYYKWLYASIYNELYMEEGNIADLIIDESNPSLPVYQPYTFVSSIEAINQNGLSVFNAHKEDIYNYSILLYHAQNQLNIDINSFLIACDNIDFTKINTNSNNTDLVYANVISNFAYGISYDIYEILNSVKHILYT